MRSTKTVLRTVVLTLSLVLITTGVATSNTINCPNQTKESCSQSAINWYHQSTEKVALYYQIYRLGGEYVDTWVRIHHPKPHSWGVALDIDETALDNSWYFKKCHSVAVTNNNDDYDKYVVLAKRSTALPGVVAFTHHVHQLGGYVTLLSNRNDSLHVNPNAVLQATIENLTQQHIYFDQVLLANGKQSKNPDDKSARFDALRTGVYNDHEMIYSRKLPAHKIVAYFGDHMHDFPIRKSNSNHLNDPAWFAKFGAGYFILPNPMY